MNLALAYGADRLWVVNVGDGKPMEFPIEFFLDYARTPKRWDSRTIWTNSRSCGRRESSGRSMRTKLRRRWRRTTRYNGRRKPELIDPSTFSLTNYDEADRVEAEWKTLAERVDKLAAELPEDERASYFELIQYPVDACANLTEMYYCGGAQCGGCEGMGNPRANAEAEKVRGDVCKKTRR